MSASWPEEHPSAYYRKAMVRRWVPALAVLALLGAALLGCAREGAPIPTGTPAISSTVAPVIPPSALSAGVPDGAKTSSIQKTEHWRQGNSLSPYLQELASQFDSGLERDFWDGTRAHLRSFDVHVAICWQVVDDDSDELPSIEAAIHWLETNGARINGINYYENRYFQPGDGAVPAFNYHLRAFVPLTLLTELPRKIDAAMIASGCQGAGGPPVGACGAAPEYCDRPLATIESGHSRDFILFTNRRTANRMVLKLEEGKDGGKVAIGACDVSGNDSTSLSHADSVTIAACSPGAAKVKLYDKNTFLWRDSLVWEETVDIFRPLTDHAILEPVFPGSQPTYPDERSFLEEHISLLKIGESATVRLNTSKPTFQSVNVSINGHHWNPDQGNLSFDDCPGGMEDSMTIGDRETFKVTACSPGPASVNARYWSDLYEREVNSQYAVYVWGPPSAYSENGCSLSLSPRVYAERGCGN